MKISENTKIKITKLQTVILKSITIAGLLSVVMVAPNALQLLKFTGDKRKERNLRQSIYNSRKRLVEKGLIEYNKNDFLCLTKEGQKELKRIEFGNYRIKKPKKWDKKWRILIFDIKERKRQSRDQLRITLNLIGFVKLQNSVWVYPYDCEDLIVLLKTDFSFGREVLYIVADRIENERTLLKVFNLHKQLVY